MKKILATFGAISAALLMSCSSSSSGGTSLAEKCENGISESCLTGATWKMNAFYSSTDGESFTAITTLTSPTTLTFKKDKSVEISYSTDERTVNSSTELTGTNSEDNGTWSISGSTISISYTFGDRRGSTGENVSYNVSIVTLADGSVGLNFGQVSASSGIHTTASTEFGYYEIFTGVEK